MDDPEMGQVFGNPNNILYRPAQSAPVQPPVVAPTLENSQAPVDAAEEIQRRRSLQGRASTILSGAAGLTNFAPTSSAQLLGLA